MVVKTTSQTIRVPNDLLATFNCLLDERRGNPRGRKTTMTQLIVMSMRYWSNQQKRQNRYKGVRKTPSAIDVERLTNASEPNDHEEDE
jgi:hypothetical protein